MDKIIGILNYNFWGNSIKNYLIFIFLFLGLFIIFRFFRLVVIDRLKVFFEKTKNDFDDFIIEVVANISKFFYWFIAFYVAIKFLNIDQKISSIIDRTFLVLIIYEIVMIINQTISYFVKKFSKNKDGATKMAYSALGRILKIVVWVVALLMILSNFGINITALAAGLGIGGLAVAFAFQSILKDLFAYFTILLDKPVRVGDFIKIGDKKGTVKNIGLKTTRLESLDGEEIVLANEQITSTDFWNYGKGKRRRVVYTIGVSYNTPVKTLKKIKKDIAKIIEKVGKDNVEIDRVHLVKLDDSSMNFEAVYYIKNRDYQLYMDLNEEINLKILELFEKLEVEIPYPTMTIYNRKG